MSDRCMSFQCKNKPTQKLTRHTVLLEDRGCHEEGSVWNSSGGLLCNECSSNLFHTKHNPLDHGFKDLRDSTYPADKVEELIAGIQLILSDPKIRIEYDETSFFIDNAIAELQANGTGVSE